MPTPIDNGNGNINRTKVTADPMPTPINNPNAPCIP
jgi:hypothetical protein